MGDTTTNAKYRTLIDRVKLRGKQIADLRENIELIRQNHINGDPASKIKNSFNDIRSRILDSDNYRKFDIESQRMIAETNIKFDELNHHIDNDFNTSEALNRLEDKLVSTHASQELFIDDNISLLEPYKDQDSDAYSTLLAGTRMMSTIDGTDDLTPLLSHDSSTYYIANTSRMMVTIDEDVITCSRETSHNVRTNSIITLGELRTFVLDQYPQYIDTVDSIVDNVDGTGTLPHGDGIFIVYVSVTKDGTSDLFPIVMKFDDVTFTDVEFIPVNYNFIADNVQGTNDLICSIKYAKIMDVWTILAYVKYDRTNNTVKHMPEDEVVEIVSVLEGTPLYVTGKFCDGVTDRVYVTFEDRVEINHNTIKFPEGVKCITQELLVNIGYGFIVFMDNGEVGVIDNHAGWHGTYRYTYSTLFTTFPGMTIDTLTHCNFSGIRGDDLYVGISFMDNMSERREYYKVTRSTFHITRDLFLGSSGLSGYRESKYVPTDDVFPWYSTLGNPEITRGENGEYIHSHVDSIIIFGITDKAIPYNIDGHKSGGDSSADLMHSPVIVDLLIETESGGFALVTINPRTGESYTRCASNYTPNISIARVDNDGIADSSNTTLPKPGTMISIENNNIENISIRRHGEFLSPSPSNYNVIYWCNNNITNYVNGKALETSPRGPSVIDMNRIHRDRQFKLPVDAIDGIFFNTSTGVKFEDSVDDLVVIHNNDKRVVLVKSGNCVFGLSNVLNKRSNMTTLIKSIAFDKSVTSFFNGDFTIHKSYTNKYTNDISMVVFSNDTHCVSVNVNCNNLEIIGVPEIREFPSDLLRDSLFVINGIVLGMKNQYSDICDVFDNMRIITHLSATGAEYVSIEGNGDRVFIVPGGVSYPNGSNVTNKIHTHVDINGKIGFMVIPLIDENTIPVNIRVKDIKIANNMILNILDSIGDLYSYTISGTINRNVSDLKRIGSFTMYDTNHRITQMVTDQASDTGGVDVSKIVSYNGEWDLLISDSKLKVYIRNGVDSITLVDHEPPSITLIGSESMTTLKGEPFVDPGYSAYDNIDGNMTSLVEVTGNVDTNMVDTYKLTYTVTDGSGNTTTKDRTINVVLPPDREPPTITITGDEIVTIIHNSPYHELGAMAYDVRDGDITANINISGDVDVNTIGSYTVTYVASDAAGNMGSATRTVNVVVEPDNVKPVITLSTTGTISVFQHSDIDQMLPTFTGIDYDAYGVSTDMTSDVVVTFFYKDVALSEINTAVLGMHRVQYDLTDTNGNVADTVVLNVNIIELPDYAPPVITLLGSSPVTINTSNTYVDSGATAFDVRDGDITSSIEIVQNTVNDNVVGEYIVRYSVSDAVGNNTLKTRNVIVEAEIDTTPPILTMSGSSSMNFYQYEGYNEPGVSAYDEDPYGNNTDLTGSITTSITFEGSPVDVGDINSSQLGTYIISYSVTNATGLTTSVSRTVVSREHPADIDPVITITGGDEDIDQGTVYNDKGATASDNKDGIVHVTTTSNVRTETPGTYTVVYRATDRDGNTVTATRNVRVNAVVVCTVPDWSKSKSYNAGDKVHYNGNHYRAKWWASFRTDETYPSNGASSSPWKLIGPCV